MLLQIKFKKLVFCTHLISIEYDKCITSCLESLWTIQNCRYGLVLTTIYWHYVMLQCSTRLCTCGLNLLPFEQIFTRQNSKYQIINAETDGNLSTKAIPSAECNKSLKINSNVKDMFYKNIIFHIPNKTFINFLSFMNRIHYLCLSFCPNLRTLEMLNELSWNVVSGSFTNISYVYP